ncbi:MAG TPA: diguanylate cyclase [Acidimicrobiales bacterium]|nr:diguanylate cyclase [Acidimicrobiales bacterium]
MGVRPTVLVIDDDSSMRRLVRTGLELEHLRVIEAASIAQVRAVLGESVDGVVLDRQLADGDGLSVVPELTARWPRVRIVVHTAFGESPVAEHAPPGGTLLPSVHKGDVVGIVEVLGLTVHEETPPCPVPQVTGEQTDLLKQRWAELCRWDPALPPDAEPALADSMVRALGAAFERPQPLGWGLDPAMESTAEAFAVNAGSVDAALAQLVCLHDAFLRIVVEEISSPDERDEARGRLDMIIHRTMVVAGQASVRQLAEDALTDALTGIHNRRAFELDLEREVARARRHRRPLSLAVIDVDGLKAINDHRGHGAGDEALRAVADALGETARQEDVPYRIGGDEFALILVDADVADEDVVVDRLRSAGAPACSVGLATLPVDGVAEGEELLHQADERLYERRRRRVRQLTAPDV